MRYLRYSFQVVLACVAFTGLAFFPGGAVAAVPMIAAGGDHACVVTQSGGVKCWGTRPDPVNGYDMPDLLWDRPQDYPGLGSGVVMVASGAYHRCALMTTGAVLCWGDNTSGQLGDGTTTHRSVPAAVSGLSSGVGFITSGRDHMCALLNTGAMKCWGTNGSGQLGDGSSTTALAPVPVVGLSSGVTMIAAGGSSSCAIMTGGALKCWGSSRIGDGTTALRRTPTDITGLAAGVQSVAVSSTAKCAIVTGGALKCWGSNTYGTVGDGTTTERLIPTDVSGMSSGVQAVSIGASPHVCVIVTNGAVKCWGRNSYGAVGSGNVDTVLSPGPVVGLDSGIVKLATGTWFTCALTAGGAARCWGDNRFGQLGDKQPGWRTTPRDVVGLSSGVADIYTGSFNAFVRTSAGGAKAWGSNSNGGTLGDGTTVIRRPTPVDVSGLASGVALIAPGFSHNCAVTTAGAALCWGDNAGGKLGDGTTVAKSVPTPVSGLATGVTTMAAGLYHSCAVTTGGGVKCWGAYPFGDSYLGDGTTSGRLTPGDVSGLASGVAGVAVGTNMSCVRTVAGGVKCWGSNFYGEVGDGTTVAKLAPVDVSGLTSGVAALSVGYNAACALTDAGGVKCWGSNFSGELGDGTTVNRSTPVDVVGMTSGVVQLTQSGGHACAKLDTGVVKCWGYNGYGTLGDGTLTSRSTPGDILGLRAPVARISAGATTTCALLTDTSVQCWGDNQNGQVGDGTVGYRTTATTYVAAPSFSQPLAVADAAAVTAPVDGAMIGRYLAGLSGSGITQGIDTTGALRTDATELARYFETIRPLLDIDGNNEFSPLTDGLLVIRYLLGQRGTALVTGAVGAGATRDGAQIQAYLAGLLP